MGKLMYLSQVYMLGSYHISSFARSLIGRNLSWICFNILDEGMANGVIKICQWHQNKRSYKAGRG